MELASTASSGISMNRMMCIGIGEPGVGAVDEGRLLAVDERRLVHTRLTSSAPGISRRSQTRGCSLFMWMTASRITTEAG